MIPHPAATRSAAATTLLSAVAAIASAEGTEPTTTAPRPVSEAGVPARTIHGSTPRLITPTALTTRTKPHGLVSVSNTASEISCSSSTRPKPRAPKAPRCGSRMTASAPVPRRMLANPSMVSARPSACRPRVSQAKAITTTAALSSAASAPGSPSRENHHHWAAANPPAMTPSAKPHTGALSTAILPEEASTTRGGDTGHRVNVPQPRRRPSVTLAAVGTPSAMALSLTLTLSITLTLSHGWSLTLSLNFIGSRLARCVICGRAIGDPRLGEGGHVVESGRRCGKHR